LGAVQLRGHPLTGLGNRSHRLRGQGGKLPGSPGLTRDVDASAAAGGAQLGSCRKPPISSTWTPDTAISGAYTTSSEAHTSVPFTSLVMRTTCWRSRVTLSLIRMALALSGPARRPSRITWESPTTVQVKSLARRPLIGYVYQMRPT